MMNYSRIIVEAIMAMKRPPVMIPPPPGCRNRTLEALDLTFEVTVPLYLLRGIFLCPRAI